MSVRTTKSVTWLWIASLLIATVGVSGQQIYCYCMGKTTFALFSTDESCAEKQAVPPKSCCAQKTSAHRKGCCDASKMAKTSHGCTKKTTKVFQLKTEFTLQEKAAEKGLSIPLDIAVAPAFSPVFQPTGFSTKVDSAGFAEPPPPLSGRMICVRHGIFRC